MEIVINVRILFLVNRNIRDIYPIDIGLHIDYDTKLNDESYLLLLC